MPWIVENDRDKWVPMKQEEFIARMTGEAVPSEQFPNYAQRVHYREQWAVLSGDGIPLVCRNTKAEAEQAAREWTLQLIGFL